ncbi:MULTISPECIES: DinI-like family protein [Symbiopectobacterium]|uniref:DinI-like family protein n=1 Tax=Symbiopectobacterium TaxID=801 RepID=UPI001A2F04F5|nr:MULTISPECIES: DinI-like family protein [Symbiopectobacterium]MBG6247027.1 DNA damage-inducible protein I [Candidatus Symbiopectobacterium sp. PLON1]MBT9429100.1 DinI-like family protein [Candidatus Symbiopectobacterium endolongispinus]
MKVEVTIAKEKKLPNGASEALQKEFGRRLEARYPYCQLTVRRAGSDGLTVFGVDRDEVSEMLQETWESADDWFN